MMPLLAAALLLVEPAFAAGPCGTVRFSGSTVQTDLTLPTSASLDASTAACVQELGSQLDQRGGVRTVTVAVKVSDTDRGNGVGRQIATAYVNGLVAGGLSAARVSSIVPAVGAGQEPGVSVTFTERPAGPAVAVVDSASGAVSIGISPTELSPAGAGATLQANRFVQTGAGGSAMLGLADGSWLKVGANSLVLVGDLYVDASLARVVKIDVLSGNVDADVAQTGGRFDIGTPSGVAGVRGTQFRVNADGAGGDNTRVETTEGSVALAGDAGAPVMLPGGMGSQVAAGTAPDPARDLLEPPSIEGPYEGRRRGQALAWGKVRKADSYLVELARDAEFVHEVTQTTLAQRALSPQLEGGTWFWRVAAVDDDGFVGMWSKVHAFDEGRVR